jgi:hypothetical protein
MRSLPNVYAVLNCYGAECSRFLYPEMAHAVAERYATNDPTMKAWTPYTVQEVDRFAPPIVPAQTTGA